MIVDRRMRVEPEQMLEQERVSAQRGIEDTKMEEALDRHSLIVSAYDRTYSITSVLVAVERLFHLGIFDPALGGDPPCSSICSGSTRIRGLHHDPAIDGSRQRTHYLFLRNASWL